MEWASEDVIGGMGADAAGWTEVGLTPTDALVETVER